MSIVSRAVQSLKQLNLFVDARTASDGNEQTRHDQVLATRVYLVLLVAILSVLVLFTCLSTRSIVVIVPKPPVETYDRLNAAYSSTLSCPCEQISVPYSSFLSVEYHLHPVRACIPLVYNVSFCLFPVGMLQRSGATQMDRLAVQRERDTDDST